MSAQCPYCSKGFPESHRVRQHIKDKHPGKKYAQFPKQAPADDGESFADRAINAELDHLMGIDDPDYDWLVEPYK